MDELSRVVVGLLHGNGEGFFAPVGNLSNRTLIGFLLQGAHESHVYDMSANGIAVGNATGGTTAVTWTQSSGIQELPTPRGASGARTITSDGNHIGGFFANQQTGSVSAGTWDWNGSEWNPSPLNPLDGLSQVLHGSSDGYYLGGTRNFNATAWIDGVFQEILLDGLALNGEVRAVTDDGFFFGTGYFPSFDDVRGFIWHHTWPEAMTIREYELWSIGYDIGRDYVEVNGATSSGGFLYLTGYPAFVLKTPALATPGCCDVTCDSIFDMHDFATLQNGFGTSSGALRIDGDLDGDGDVDLADATTLINSLGDSCP